MEDLGYTNVAALEMFEQELALFETEIKPHSRRFEDYILPAELIKNALMRIVTASPADTYTLMRRLVDHINDKIDDEYSDFAIRMMGSATATKDVRANQLIMSVLYVTRDVLIGEKVELNDYWLRLVDRNMNIFTFLKNYERSDQKQVEDTYSGNVIAKARTTEKLELSDSRPVVTIGYANYDVKLTGDVMQVVSFVCSSDIHREDDAIAHEDLTIVSNITLTPTIGVLALDRSIGFYDDAKAQINAQGNRYIHGYDTQITLPGLFYSAALSIISSDSGKTWRVTEVNILPPSLT